MSHSAATISPLRQRMIDDMTQRRLKPGTQRSHILGVRRLAAFLQHSPATATAEDLRRFQLQLATSGVSAATINCTIAGLRFLFKVTLDKPKVLSKISLVHEPRKLPVILTPDEVRQLLQAVSSLKYKAALSVAYGSGLRASEITHLRVTDIDSQRMLIHVSQGKGDREAQCLAVARLARVTAGLVALCPGPSQDAQRRLVIPRAEPGQSRFLPAAQSSLSRRRPSRGLR